MLPYVLWTCLFSDFAVVQLRSSPVIQHSSITSPFAISNKNVIKIIHFFLFSFLFFSFFPRVIQGYHHDSAWAVSCNCNCQKNKAWQILFTVFLWFLFSTTPHHWNLPYQSDFSDEIGSGIGLCGPNTSPVGLRKVQNGLSRENWAPLPEPDCCDGFLGWVTFIYYSALPQQHSSHTDIRDWSLLP